MCCIKSEHLISVIIINGASKSTSNFHYSYLINHITDRKSFMYYSYLSKYQDFVRSLVLITGKKVRMYRKTKERKREV